MVIHLDTHQHYGPLIIPRSKNNLLTSALPIIVNSKTKTKAILNRRF